MRHLRYCIALSLILTPGLFFFSPNISIAKESLDTLIEVFEEEKQNESDPPIDDVLEGFDDAVTDTPFEDDKPLRGETDHGKESLSTAGLDGYVKLGATWNFAHDPPETGETDWRGLSRCRPEARIDLDAKVMPHWRLLIGTKLFYDYAYTLKGRDEFTEEVLDAYEDEIELAEAFVQGRLSRHLDVKAGRQIVVRTCSTMMRTLRWIGTAN
jgi:hypothetical protein